jgi:hypothetical protein
MALAPWRPFGQPSTLEVSRFNLPKVLMPWDTEAYDTYTGIPDPLGFAGIYRLIGINSIMT